MVPSVPFHQAPATALIICRLLQDSNVLIAANSQGTIKVSYFMLL